MSITGPGTSMVASGENSCSIRLMGKIGCRSAGPSGCRVPGCSGGSSGVFSDGSTLLLQTDYDQAAFAVACGAIQAPDDWDGLPSKLGECWASFVASSIVECPDCYLDVAEQPEDEQ